MNRFILIETSTALCSVALCEEDRIVSSRFKSGREHSALTTPFVQEVLQDAGVKITDCQAVCVSMGPGSYTGLRVGVSTAKGLCFGAGLPLLAVSSLEVLAAGAIQDGIIPEGYNYIIPMVDARRMEVYAAVFNAQGDQLSPIEARIIDEGSFKDERSKGGVLYIGDGALKCSSMLGNAGSTYYDCCPKAEWMAPLALREYKEKRFKDVAYFEPLYIKDFVATVSRKRLF